MNIILFEDHTRSALLPFTFTRPVGEIRVGILTIREKWEKYLGKKVSHLTKDYLQERYPLKVAENNLLINGKIFPDKNLVEQILKLQPGQKIISGDVVVAWRTGEKELKEIGDIVGTGSGKAIAYKTALKNIFHLTDIFTMNGEAIREDFDLLTAKRKSAKLSLTNKALNQKNIFIEKGAKVECSVLNATDGPVYIGANAEVMEGSIIRGPFALCNDSTVRLGTKIYGDTTIGPFSKVGGEISNSVIFGCSNKAHDGFLGNSVIGEWCNLGAGTNNSNLKNNYSFVKLWDYEKENYINTGLQFCGLIMGDHSKASINTMLNTGTVVGVNANIFGTGFPPKFIPSFSWGGAEKLSTFRIEEALEVARKVFERRKMKFDKTEEKILRHVFEESTKHRAW
ncbi:MAG TPA: GlmU family protein [Bacteroidia bacterium]|nr:GlmU family protein [Bacteroidia bacterium]